MKKRISLIALASLMAMPAAGMAASTADLEKQIESLSKQLEMLKSQVAEQAEENRRQKEQNEAVADTVSDIEDTVDDLDDRADGWDLASRFNVYGDFRARFDYYNADGVGGTSYDNDSLLTNRLRMNVDVKATENIEFKGRFAMFKTWGDQSAWNDDTGMMYPVFDGNVTRTPREDSALYVDRAYVNWTGIAGLPIWFSIGRRPTTDGVPANIRMNNSSRMATPMAFMDWPFDGLTLGYAYDWSDEASGKFRFCYGRGFEEGLDSGDPGSIDDMDFAGFAWDILKQDDRFLYFQSYMAFDVISYPNFQDPIINENFGTLSGMGDRANVGKIWHTSAAYVDKLGPVNYFLALGWSQTDPNSNGMFNNPMVGANTDKEDGYSVYVGARYDLDDAGLKFGVEYNYGSQYWLAMAPGHDDIYASKLATRGNVWEVYTIWDIPGGEKLSKYADAFMRLGYQHYEYDYTGSGDWNMAPFDLGDAQEMAMYAMMAGDPVESADQVYLTFEVYF